MSARFLVTGSTGFVGRRLIRRLVSEHGAASIACVVGPPANPREAEAMAAHRAQGIRLIAGDLLASPVSAEPAPRCDAVFHLAASIELGAGEAALRVNDEGTRRFLDWLGGAASGGRVLYVSSIAVHDRSGPPEGPISEASPFSPRTAYGRTKLRGEELVRERSAAQGYAWTVIRLPTVYGPGQREGGLFETMLRLAPAGALLARLDWPGRTSVIHVDDVAEALVAFAGLPQAAGQAYNVASEEHPTIGDIARLACEAAGKPFEPIAIPRALLAAARALVWSRLALDLAPGPARLALWRLSLMVSDGFWFDTAKFRDAYSKPLRALKDGLAESLREGRG